MVEQVLQAGAEKVDDQDVVEPFLAEVIDIRNPGWMRSVMFLERETGVCVWWWLCVRVSNADNGKHENKQSLATSTTTSTVAQGPRRDSPLQSIARIV